MAPANATLKQPDMNTKKRLWNYALTVIGFACLLNCGCSKDDNNDPAAGVRDIDGNVYSTVTVGTQVWLVENLKATRYSNGDPIPNVAGATLWSNLTTGAYCNFDNSTANAATYGRLYNWYAVETGNLCPTGWHVPTDAEWTALTDYLETNGFSYDGATPGIHIAKSLSSTTLWQSSTATGAVGNTDYPAYRNKTGFTALPGGYRYFGSEFNDLNLYGYWWTATEAPQSDGWYRTWSYNNTQAFRNHTSPRDGFSVRCVKD